MAGESASSEKSVPDRSTKPLTTSGALTNLGSTLKTVGGKLSGVFPFRNILFVTTLFEKFRKVRAE